MGAFDKADDVRDKVEDVKGKIEDVTEENVDKLGALIDKAADKVDVKTEGKHSDKIDKVVDPLQNPAEATGRAEEPPGRATP